MFEHGVQKISFLRLTCNCMCVSKRTIFETHKIVETDENACMCFVCMHHGSFVTRAPKYSLHLLCMPACMDAFIV
jgi:hypothetical protein